MEHKFRVGDLVIIRKDLGIGTYGNNSVVEDMLKYRGELTTITRGDVNDDGNYKLAIDRGEWYWTTEMLKFIKYDEGGMNWDGLQI